MTTDINLYLEGQSNALLAADWGAVWTAERIIEAAVPGVDVHWQYAWGRDDGHNTINSGTSLMYWTRGGWWPADGDNHMQRGAWDFVSGLPAAVRDDPTVIYRLHTEDDGMEDFQRAGQYEEVVREHVAELRDRLGQDADTTPVVFGVVPYARLPGSWDQVFGGMQRMADDAGFNAAVGTATENWAWSDGSHYRPEFMDELGAAIAHDLLPAVAELAGQAPPDDGGGGGGGGGEPPAEGEAWREDFNGTLGHLSHAWGDVDLSRSGFVTLTGLSGFMEAPTGAEAGNGYGTFKMHAKIDSPSGEPSPALVWWQGDDVWGVEADMGEMNYSWDGGQFAAYHWKDSAGRDVAEYIDLGDNTGRFATYEWRWSPDKVEFFVDGAFKGKVEGAQVGEDFAHGGVNMTTGALTDAVDGSYVTVDWASWAPLGGGTDPDPGEDPDQGGPGADRITGGPGYQELTGGGGADTFVFRYGDGAGFPHDAITDFQLGVDRLELPGGVTALEHAEEGLWVAYGRSPSDNDWVLLRGVAEADEATLLNGGDDTEPGGGGGGGGTWPAPEGGGRTILGEAGDDSLVGGSDGDVIVGGAGDDLLVGRGGPDVFGFSEGDGADRVRRFDPGVDTLMFRGVAEDSVRTEVATHGGRTGLDVHYGTEGDVVFLAGVQALAAGDIVFA